MNLTLLSFVTFTGSEPVDGRTCQAAMQIAVDAANNMPAFWRANSTRYFIKVQFRDEGAVGMQTTRNLMKYLNEETSEIKMPVIVGPRYACQHSARTASHFNMVQFSTGCGGALFTANRKAFPNLFRFMMPYDSSLMSKLAFIHRIGRWRRISILTFSGNSNEFNSAKRLFDVHVKLGGRADFNAVPDVTPALIASLKESGTRIVLFESVQIAMVQRFLCLSHSGGLKSPRYIFIFSFLTFVDPNSQNLPCSGDVSLEQLKATFFAGNLYVALKNYGPVTVLGYDLTEFERRLQEKLGDAKHPPDYDTRFICHDPMLAALLALRQAEHVLNGRNKSLADFSIDPALVQHVVEQSGRKDFNGLRIGRQEFSERLETDKEDIWIGQWDQSKKQMRHFAKITYVGNTNDSIFDLSKYEMDLKQLPIWPTMSNKPPTDLSQIFSVKTKFPDVLTYPARILSILSSLIAVAFAITLHQFSRKLALSREFQYRRILQPICQYDSMLLAFGCVSLNLSAAFFSIDAFYQPKFFCSAKVICLLVGLASIEGAQMSKLRLLNQKIVLTIPNRNPRSNSKRVRHALKNVLGNLVVTNIHQNWEHLEAPKHDALKQFFVRFGSLIANSLYLSISLGVASHQLTQHFVQHSEVLYDEHSNQLQIYETHRCITPLGRLWIGLAIIYHVIFLFIAAYQANTLKSRLSRLHHNSIEFGLTANDVAFSVNALAILVASLGSSFILPDTYLTALTSVIIAGILVLSISSAILFNVPLLRHLKFRSITQ